MYSASVELSVISICSLLDQCIGTPANTMMNPVCGIGTNLVSEHIRDAILQRNNCHNMRPMSGFYLVSSLMFFLFYIVNSILCV
jgi:hypothetical protein